MKGLFVRAEVWWLLNPDLGTTEVARKLRTRTEILDGARRAKRLHLTLSLVAVPATVAGVGTVPTAALVTVGILLLGIGGLTAAAAIAAHARATRLRRQASALEASWIDAGEAVSLEPLDAFVVAEDVSEAATWSAATLVRDAGTHAGRVAWAQTAREEHRLSPNADPVLDELQDADVLMYRRAAALLDPDGERTAAWLREYAR